VEYAKALAPRVIDRPIEVRVGRAISWPFLATYGDGVLTLNLGRLGHAFFEKGPTSNRVHELLIHELAHEWASEHLSREFYDACCTVGARLAGLAIADPEFFEAHRLSLA
jgi:hypothetical protein